jgi:hypothetical protein
MGDLILEAFDNLIRREIAGAGEVREEIKRRGTYWAGDEIWKLRRQVKGAAQSGQRARWWFAHIGDRELRSEIRISYYWRRRRPHRAEGP